MAFKSFERSTFNLLSMTVLSTLGVAKTHAQISKYLQLLQQPRHVLHSHRMQTVWLVMMHYLKFTGTVKPRIVSEQRAVWKLRQNLKISQGRLHKV